MAGAVGFEPTHADTKTGALPLGYAPSGINELIRNKEIFQF